MLQCSVWPDTVCKKNEERKDRSLDMNKCNGVLNSMSIKENKSKLKAKN